MLKRHSKRSVLSVNRKKLRRPCLDRFAVFAKASRNSQKIYKAERVARQLKRHSKSFDRLRINSAF